MDGVAFRDELYAIRGRYQRTLTDEGRAIPRAEQEEKRGA